MTRQGLALIVTAGSFLATLVPAKAPAADSHRQVARAASIAFLHLKLGPNSAELARFEITPGRLKPGVRHAGDRILLRVESAGGALLWEGTIDDPRTQIVEGSDVHGRAVRKVIERPAPEVMARVPFFEQGQVVRVLRVTPAPAAQAHEQLLGTFELTK